MEAINENVVTEKNGLNMESIPDMKDNLEEGLVSEESPSEETKKQERPDIMITEELMNEEIKKLDSLNFIELLQYQKELESRKRDMSYAKDAATELLRAKDQLKMVENEDNSISAEIEAANAENKSELPEEDINSFLENYDISIGRMEETLKAVDEKIKEFDDIKKTATYMNQAMREIIQKKQKEMADLEAAGGTPSKIAVRYYAEMEKIYTNRDSIEFVLDQIPKNKIFVRRWIESIKKERNRNLKNSQIIASTQSSVTKEFCKIFSPKQMVAFENYLKTILITEGEDDTPVFLMQYMLYIIYSNNKVKQRGQGKWIETLIMNVLDIINDNYDLPNGVDYYNEQLKKICDSVMEGLPKVKL